MNWTTESFAKQLEERDTDISRLKIIITDRTDELVRKTEELEDFKELVEKQISDILDRNKPFKNFQI